jgi:HK97 family phage prohead protease
MARLREDDMLGIGLPLHIEEFKAAGTDWEVSGYVSTFGNTDRGYDIVQPGAFDRTLADGHTVKFLHSHKPELVLGVPKELKPDKKGLFARFKISKTQLGQDTHTLLQDGALDSFSIGYIPRGWEWQRDDESDYGEVRLLKDLDLLECSLVAVPMNPEATVTGVKNFELSLVQQAATIRADLETILRAARAIKTQDRQLTEIKRQEIAGLLATFAGMDAVRSDLQQIVAAPNTSAQSIALRLALTRRKLRAAGILED